MKFFGLEFRTPSQEIALREEMSLMKRSLEDIGWINLTQDQYSREELIAGGFHFMIKRCRIMYVNNPLCKHWVHLTTSFVFGRGVSVPKTNDKDLQEILEKFWDDPDNQKIITSFHPQRMLSNKIQYEGNLFFMLFDDEEGDIRVRVLNTVEVVDIITDNDDRNKYLFYKVTLTDRKYNYNSDSFDNIKTQVWYIPDIDNENPNDYGIPASKQKFDCRIFHVKLNCDINDKFGIPDLYAGLDWVKAHKDMAGDMATMIKALSQFAWKKKVKGGSSQVNSILNKMKATTNLSNISTMAGKTQIENEGVDMQSIDVKTGGIDIAEKGLKSMQMMVCSASGLFYHYFGDPSTGNLATATSMELPMIKKFQDYQLMWTYIFRVIMMYLFRKKIEVGLLPGSIEHDSKTGYTSIVTDKDLMVDIDFPPIIEDDPLKLAQSLQIAQQAGLISDEAASRLYLLGMEVDDIDQEIENALADKEKRRADMNGMTVGEPAVKAPASTSSVKQQNTLANPSINEAMIQRIVKMLKEGIDVPAKPGTRLNKKNNYLMQRMNGYRKALAGHFKNFQKDIKDGVKVSGKDGKYVGTVSGMEKSIKRLGVGMKMSAKMYYPEAVKIGEKYVQSHLERKAVKVNETLYETANKSSKVLQDRLDWNASYIDSSLLPDIQEKLDKTIKQDYDSEESFTEAVNTGVNVFEARMEQYVGALWTVEENAVKEAGAGTGLMVNFVGEEDDHNCQGCEDALANNPYPIDDAPQPGEQDCLGRCRHALQIVDDSES